jgi:hypothetical protein
MMTDFETEFRCWLEQGLARGVPEDVAAFSFNLFEPASSEISFGVELIGAKFFDPNDDDWACDDSWQIEPRRLGIPKDWSSCDWGTCLRRMHDLIDQILRTDNQAFAALNQRKAVAVGFVDGSLETVWRNT